MKTLTREEFNSLTESEQIVAKALGLVVEPRKKTRKGHVRSTSGEPYILVTNVSCRLCNSLYTRVFKMSKQRSFLHSEEIARIPSEEELQNMKVKSSHYTVRHCCKCYSYLSNLTKEDLVQKFLSYINDSRNFII
jgi:hypothetical protein